MQVGEEFAGFALDSSSLDERDAPIFRGSCDLLSYLDGRNVSFKLEEILGGKREPASERTLLAELLVQYVRCGHSRKT
jgi:hypothetical protein